MAVLKIIKEPDDALRKACRPVEKINNRILTLLDDMRETLENANGIGLAAPQIGVLRRVVIIEDEDGNIIELINPEIIASSGVQEETEGCLSSPGKYAVTRRPMNVTVKALNRGGKEVTYERNELIARAFCHEIDHLNGILCFDNCIKLLTDEEIEMMREGRA